MPDQDSVLVALQSLHDDVSCEAGVLHQQHAARLQCRMGCADCCVDDLQVFEVEAERIRRETPGVLREQPHPVGRCAFLDGAGACRIYTVRPYVCRTQGLPLRWVEEDEDGVWLEYRDICPLNEAGQPIETLAETDCWTLGPNEGRLAQLARDFEESSDSGRSQARSQMRSQARPQAPSRVSLRSLFD